MPERKITDIAYLFKRFINMKEYIVSGFSWAKSGGTTVHHFPVITEDEDMALEAVNYFVSTYRAVEINNPPSQTGTVDVTYYSDEEPIQAQSGLYDDGGYKVGDYTAAGITTKPICCNYDNGATITFENNSSLTLSKSAAMGDTTIYGTLTNSDLGIDTKCIPINFYRVNNDDSIELVNSSS